MRILVLGGGMMGSEIAKDLVKHGYDIAVADNRKLDIDGIETIQRDLSTNKMDLIKQYDLIVNALPASLGFGAVQVAIEAKKKCVDLSYSPMNILQLHGYAEIVGALVVPDAGVAPGISNLITGRAINAGHTNITTYVGGFAKDEAAPLGYAVSWSTEDLLDEFVRPARIISGGRIKKVDALSGLNRIYVPEVGGLDAFYTDGLRTLLYYKKDYVLSKKANIAEKTMRREGHIEETKQLIKSGEFQKYVEDNCVGLQDTLVMRVDTGNEVVDMVVDGDDEMSAMARSTALSCSVFTQLVAEGRINGKGIIPPEVISEDVETYKYLLDKLAENGINFSVKYPFI